MARTKIEDMDGFAIGQEIEVVTTHDFEDDPDNGDQWVHNGVVADFNKETEQVNVTDHDTGEPEWFTFEGTDEEKREWFAVTEDDVELTIDQQRGYMALSYQEKRDALQTQYEIDRRALALKHQADLDKLQHEEYLVPNTAIEAGKTE